LALEERLAIAEPDQQGLLGFGDDGEGSEE
jgi:hypothetical protein